METTFDSFSDCPPGWANGLRFDPSAVWIHRDGRRFVAVLPRPNGGNLLLVTPEGWGSGWEADCLEVYPDGEIRGPGEWLHVDDFHARGQVSL